jgi:hypothetical protein
MLLYAYIHTNICIYRYKYICTYIYICIYRYKDIHIYIYIYTYIHYVLHIHTYRLERDVDARASGIIINTSGSIDSPGYDVLRHCMDAFHIDVVLVMGHDKLYSKFSSDVAEHITVVKLPKSGGVVDRVSNLVKFELF